MYYLIHENIQNISILENILLLNYVLLSDIHLKIVDPPRKLPLLIILSHV